MYHCSLHTSCPFSLAKAYMISLMASCMAIPWPSNGQRVKYVPNAFNPCPHSHMRIIDVEGWIKLRRKHNVEVKLKCAMKNKQIDDFTINHSPIPLPKQEQIQVLNVEEMESFSKIYLKDVLWWMSIKNTWKLWASIIAKLSKKRCISLTIGGKLSQIAWRHD